MALPMSTHLALLLTGLSLGKMFSVNHFPYYHAVVPLRLRKFWEENLARSLRYEIKVLLTIPIACLFVRHEVRTDRVKRRNKQQITMLREYPINFFRNYGTHDNAIDEWFWGAFAEEGDYGYEWTEHQYSNSWWKRYYARMAWCYRNVGYTYLYEQMGVVKEDEPLEVFEQGVEDTADTWVRIEVYNNYFLYEWQQPTTDGKYRHIKFGWKSHRSAPVIEATGKINVMYANRFYTFKKRKYE